MMTGKLILLLTTLLFTACRTDTSPDLAPGTLLCENLRNPLGIGSTTPRLSWINTSGRNGAVQTAFRIIAASAPGLLDKDSGDLWDSGKVISRESVLVPWTGSELGSRSMVYWKVRTWDGNGTPSGWSETARFSVGLLRAEDWKAEYIGLAPEEGDPDFPQLRKSFNLEEVPSPALLHVNSLGYHEVFLNGRKIDDSVLTPAVSQMNRRTFIITYDVTPYLRQGTNTLAIWLGEGWFSDGLPGVDWAGPVVRAQLEFPAADGWCTLISTGGEWKARPSEITRIGTWRSGRYGGERVDARLAIADFSSPELDDSSWPDAATVTIPDRLSVPQKAERNRIQETLLPVDIRKFEGRDTWLVDFGKNLTGWVEADFSQAKTGQEITMDFSDFFLDEGTLKNQGQQDIYIAGPQEKKVFRNRFNYHGFRYVKIKNLKEKPGPDSIKAFLIHTDYGKDSSFQSSDQDLNRIHDMIAYTLRCLSLGGYLVDCPQIERLGYGGDGNASTLTAQTMFNLGPLYSGWLDHWTDCIRPDGGMPHTAPNPYPAGGGPYWCGFIITASWNTYRNYGDSQVLADNYPAMKQWLGYVDRYSPLGLLTPWPETDYRAWYLGDWASPDGIDDTNRESIDLVANTYLVVCLETMEKIAMVLGHDEDAAGFRTRKDKLVKLVQQNFYHEDAGIYADGDQIELAFPLIAGIVPEALRERVTGSLKRNISERNNGHLAAGLVGIPVMTEWATTSGSADLMYSMLKKRDYPGYLYMIDNGATTTWEHWNGERSRIHNCFNGIGSWFYQAPGGIRPLEEFPAYRRFRIDPQVPKGLAWVKAAKDTPYGPIRVSWEKSGDTMTVHAGIPVGTEAEVTVHPGFKGIMLNGRPAESGTLILPSGNHQVEWILETGE